MDKVAVIVLAAGLGTRMKSNDAKVLHKIDGKEMIHYVLDAARKVVGENIVVVVGYQAEKVEKVVYDRHKVLFAKQEKQLGTGHAVRMAVPVIPPNADDVIVLCGDVPLIRADTLKKMIEDHKKEHRDITVLAVEIDNPKGYGRIVFDEKRRVEKIVEEADADEVQRKINVINTGIYCFDKDFLIDAISKIKSDNAQNEFYLTDVIGVGREENKTIGVIIGEETDEFIGVNSIEELKKVESLVRMRLHKP